MPVEKSPAFQFYPQDFLADDKVMAMDTEARGVYIMLLCHCWVSGCIPDQPAILQRLALWQSCQFDSRTSAEQWAECWGMVGRCFIAEGAPPGCLVNPRIERERHKQAIYRAFKKVAGQRGGIAKALKHKALLAEPYQKPSRSLAEAYQTPSRSLAKASTTSSSSSPIPDLKDVLNQNKQASSDTGQFQKTNGNGVYVSVPVPINGSTDEALTERAGRFCERYAELYPQHRKGARYLPKPALDWPKAIDLCRTWDDLRLEKLAIVFLKTDHDFAAKGSRTIGQFAALASWCDDRLREVESGGR